MSRRTVVQLMNFPTREVVTGGQIRVDRLGGFLSRQGLDRRRLGVTPLRDDIDDDDLCLDRAADAWAMARLADFEMRLVDAARLDSALMARLAARLAAIAPDILWFEQPFLWPLVKQLLASRSVAIVYSAHNVEWRTKRSLGRVAGRTDPAAVERIAAVERDLIAHADLVVACSTTDAAAFRAMGAVATSVVLNGADPPVIDDGSDAGAVAALRRRLDPPRPVLAFIGSDYEPNWLGLRDLVIEPMLPGGPLAHVQLLLMGDISHRFAAWLRETGSTLPGVVSLGRVDAAMRSAAFRLADLAVLPLTTGGGTNLKTAEALLSRSDVIGTPTAFRGFEAHLTAPGVHCEAHADFACRIAALAQADRPAIEARAMARHPIVAGCAWSAILTAAAGEPLLRQCLDGAPS